MNEERSIVLSNKEFEDLRAEETVGISERTLKRQLNSA